ncbi:hypothetical protein VRB78_06105 [Pseudomonas trivialis]|uniref:hypothetical protein n=1 Tax=Pseudomonas trivialis TaxID=200450 RepID=UPI0030CFC3A4
MKIKLSVSVFLLWASVAFSDEPARLIFSSATDFTDISLDLKKAERSDPDKVEVHVKLSPEAEARTKSISLLAYRKYLTVYVDGYKLSTAMVQGQLGANIMIVAPRALVIEWMNQFSAHTTASQPTM